VKIAGAFHMGQLLLDTSKAYIFKSYAYNTQLVDIEKMILKVNNYSKKYFYKLPSGGFFT
jgi:hypothetical protein